ncbi:nucleoside permease [Fodinibius salsisoli]|uniref:Nucleoside permease n=1 Tax=Fodinibius salsisoli TaxID=2820877 RepID=A0ABT3PMX7_9BACT|nr:nucleoside permease [Fodinibius salsisoli]MCW9706494.1 nucleoside permease [Fodinibius salsisoli]
MNRLLQTKLSLMMFLEFFIWGAWYSTVAVYMTANGMENLTHWPFMVNPIAAIVAPFFVGLIADRYFPTEKVLGTLHLLGALFMVLTPMAVSSPVVFILLLLAYNLCYMPTMSLANTLSFHHINDQEKDFPVIRVFGTIGWIVAGLIISFVLGYFVSSSIKPEETALPLYLTAAASLLLGLYSFTLPHTPPPAAGEKVSFRSIAGIDALKQLGSKSFYVFLFSSFLICIPLAAYYNFTQIFLNNANFDNIAATLTIGQMSEALFMVLIPLMFVRLGVKWMLAAGMLAWILRYVFFAFGAPEPTTWMIITGIALHGICYDFFFVTGQIYVDKKAPANIRGQAQGLIVLITYGVGMFIGARVAGRVFNSFLGDAAALNLSQWQDFWWIPAIFAACVLLFFILFFNDQVIDKDATAEDISV